MTKQTVLVPDGYTGNTVLMYADPIEEWADGTVKLRCAEPGKEHLIRWVGKWRLAILLESQRHETQG
jgi:fatty acid/phospholipid biosynthesis enzyme